MKRLNSSIATFMNNKGECKHREFYKIQKNNLKINDLRVIGNAAIKLKFNTIPQ